MKIPPPTGVDFFVYFTKDMIYNMRDKTNWSQGNETEFEKIFDIIRATIGNNDGRTLTASVFLTLAS